MPWKETCVVDHREELVLAVLSGEASVSDLCRRAAVSRKTAYKWVERFKSGGREALADRSRARLTQDHAVGAEVTELIVGARRAHPTWGVKKILPYLEERHDGLELPSLSTASEILRRADLTKPQKRSRPQRRPVGTHAVPNCASHTWTTDFKGQFRLGDGDLCYPLTVVDAFSRYLLCVDGKRSTGLDGVISSFRSLFREHGLPERIRSDNGTPFAGNGLARLSRLNVWFMQLGIAVDRINPGRPCENGSHERMHRTLKAETARPPRRTMLGQQRRFNAFRAEYNEERPHEAIGQRTPATLYTRSQRPYYGDIVDEDVYAGHWERRRVRSDGTMKWRGEQVFVAEPLAGRLVGLVETDEDLWQLHYQSVLLGVVDCRGGEIEIRDALRRDVARREARIP